MTPLEYEFKWRVGPCTRLGRLKVACESRDTRKPPGEHCEADDIWIVGARRVAANRYRIFIASHHTVYDECALNG
jgi:hypothetical protein